MLLYNHLQRFVARHFTFSDVAGLALPGRRPGPVPARSSAGPLDRRFTPIKEPSTAASMGGSRSIESAPAEYEPQGELLGQCRRRVFFSSLKKEHQETDLQEPRTGVSRGGRLYRIFYNRTRRHSHLGGVSREQFEAAHKLRRRGVH